MMGDVKDILSTLEELITDIIHESEIKANDAAKTQKTILGLEQQVSEKVDQLEAERREKTAEIQRAKALEGELLEVKSERDSQAKEKGKAREEAELTSLQLDKAQDDLERVYLADQKKMKELEALKQQVSDKAAELEAEIKQREVEAERIQSLEGDLLGVKDERDARARELGEAREEAELTLLQLDKVQEELEYYFERSRCAVEIATAQKDQLVRAQALMARFIPEIANYEQNQSSKINILTKTTTMENKLQTEALLDTYAASLRRASILLRRVVQS